MDRTTWLARKAGGPRTGLELGPTHPVALLASLSTVKSSPVTNTCVPPGNPCPSFKQGLLSLFHVSDSWQSMPVSSPLVLLRPVEESLTPPPPVPDLDPQFPAQQ